MRFLPKWLKMSWKLGSKITIVIFFPKRGRRAVGLFLILEIYSQAGVGFNFQEFSMRGSVISRCAKLWKIREKFQKSKYSCARKVLPKM